MRKKVILVSLWDILYREGQKSRHILFRGGQFKSTLPKPSNRPLLILNSVKYGHDA